VLLKACKLAGTESKIREAQIVAIRLIMEVSPEIEPEAPHLKFDVDYPDITEAAVYETYNTLIYFRLIRGEPSSALESIRGESPKVRHLEAYQMADYVQRRFNKCGDPYNSQGWSFPGHGLDSVAWSAVTAIKQFAPDLVTDEEGVYPYPAMDPFAIIQRLVAATAWAN
jgi:hypothetical protein